MRGIQGASEQLEGTLRQLENEFDVACSDVEARLRSAKDSGSVPVPAVGGRSAAASCAGALSMDELSFDQVDVNGDGVIDRREWQAAAQQRGVQARGKPRRGGDAEDAIRREIDALQVPSERPPVMMMCRMADWRIPACVGGEFTAGRHAR